MDGGSGVPETVEGERSHRNPHVIPDEEDDEGGDDEDDEEDDDAERLLLVRCHQLTLYDGTERKICQSDFHNFQGILLSKGTFWGQVEWVETS